MEKTYFFIFKILILIYDTIKYTGLIIIKIAQLFIVTLSKVISILGNFVIGLGAVLSKVISIFGNFIINVGVTLSKVINILGNSVINVGEVVNRIFSVVGNNIIRLRYIVNKVNVNNVVYGYATIYLSRFIFNIKQAICQKFMSDDNKLKLKCYLNKFLVQGSVDDGFINCSYIFSHVTPDLLRNSGLSSALPLYSKLALLTQLSDIHFLNELCKFYVDTKSILVRSEGSSKNDENGKSNLYINFPLWGDKYTKVFIKYMAPSLLAKGNLPAIAKNNPTTLQIFCDEHSKDLIKKSKVYKELSKVSNIDFHLIPEKVFKFMNSIADPSHRETAKYMIYGTAQCLGAFQATQNKGLISFLNADTAIGQNALSNAISFINEGKIAVFTNSFRSNLDTIEKELSSYLVSQTILDLPHDDLVHLQVKHIHPSALRRLVSSNTEYFNVTPQLLFYDGEGLVSRSLHYHPFMLSFKLLENIRIDTGYPLDGDIPNLISSFKDRFDDLFKVVEDARGIGVLELSSTDAEPANMNLSRLNTKSNLLKIVTGYFKSKNVSAGEEFLLSKRTCYNSSNKQFQSIIKGKFKDPINDIKFINKATGDCR